MAYTLDSFQFYDMWLLLSLSGSRAGRDLESIIGAGDRYNHAIIELDELNYGMSKLIHNGFAEDCGERRFRETDKAKAYFSAHKKNGEPPIANFLRLCELFQNEQALPDCEYREYFSKADFEKAYERYSKMANAIIQKIMTGKAGK